MFRNGRRFLKTGRDKIENLETTALNAGPREAASLLTSIEDDTQQSKSLFRV